MGVQQMPYRSDFLPTRPPFKCSGVAMKYAQCYQYLRMCAIFTNWVTVVQSKRNGMPRAYLVVDDADRLIVEVPYTFPESDTESCNLNTPASNEELDSVKARYLVGG